MPKEIIIDLSGQVFTQSEITLWDACPFKWYQRYYLQKSKKGELQWPLIVGTIWHMAMETFYRAKSVICPSVSEHIPEDVVVSSEIQLEIQYWQQVLEATLQAYAIFFKDDFKQFKIIDLEKTLECEIEIDGVTFKLAGKIDMKGTRGKTDMIIFDHKTVSQISNSITEGWGYKFQFMFYLWLDWRVNGAGVNKFMVNAVRKTQLRQGKGEHIHTFAARVKTDILKRPADYFYRQDLDLTAEGILSFEKAILMPKLRRIAMLQNNRLDTSVLEVLALNKNTDQCNMYGAQCEFFDLCYHGENGKYKKRAVKHEEL